MNVVVVYLFFFRHYEIALEAATNLFHGSTAPDGQGLLTVDTSRSHSHTPHSVGLHRTSDRPELTSNTTLKRHRHPSPPSGIRTRNSSKPAAADPRLILCSHCDQEATNTRTKCAHIFQVRPVRFCIALGLNVHLRRCIFATAKHVTLQVILISLKYIYTYAHFVKWTNFWNVSTLLNVFFFKCVYQQRYCL
jgi:hypothetical protein